MSVAVSTKPVAGEERFLLTGISWSFYQAFCDELEGRPIRLTYDNGMLEIMITKRPHEYHKKLLAKLVEQTVLFFNVPVASGGSMTLQREDLLKGFEPDECWWIAHEQDVRGQFEFDFQHDPPPDLAIEVEITSSLVSRVSIYAAMGVPEIWRCDGESLRFCILQDDGAYADSTTSLAFPFLAPERLFAFIQTDPAKDETTIVREYVDWLGNQDFAIS